MSQETFVVKEGEKKDAGRAIVRLALQDMEKSQFVTGDLVVIEGQKTTGAKVLPALPLAREPGAIQIDGLTRENAGVGIGEKVRVRKIERREAEQCVIEPIGTTLLSGKDSAALKRLLADLPVCTGDRVRISPFANKYQEFRVTKLVPEGPSVVSSATRVTLDVKEQSQEVYGKRGKKSTTYEDVGGLKKEIQKIREVIELPLRHPELFERVGIEAPKGVLLYGSPGCGKTLIAKAVANEVQANFYSISGPEIFVKWVGESAQRLRQLFDQAAKTAPSIIFIDEIDALAPKRSEIDQGGAAAEQHKNVVAQLLSCMDGLEDRGRVIVIGATNIPDNLDPALRRPGRFDREIEIGVPDRDGRFEILEIHTRSMPLAEDVSLEKLATATHGFVGADLAALAREAAMGALRRNFSDIDLEEGCIAQEKLEKLKVCVVDFERAKKEVHPSALREVFLEKPDVGWDDVGGLEDVKEALKETIEWPLIHPELFEHTSTIPPRGILIAGPPGCGKTLIAKAVAKETEVNFISVKGPELVSKWVGDTEKHIREIFRKAKQAAPCIIFFDEIDAIAPRRGRDTSGGSDRALSQLLNEIDGVEELKGVVIIAATNRIDLLDEAILRPGRFDIHFELSLPDQNTRLNIFEIHTRRKPIAKDVDLRALANRSEGFTGADIMGICVRASLLAMREFLDTGEKDIAKCEIKQEHFDKAFILFLPSLEKAGAEA